MTLTPWQERQLKKAQRIDTIAEVTFVFIVIGVLFLLAVT